MEDIKRRFANEIAAKLAAAPESDAKSEMIEELAENLAGRYGDMLSAGTPEDEAFARAMDQLGDADELAAYLRSQEPDEGADGPETASQAGMDEFFQTIGEMGQAIGDMAREAAQRAGDFFRSDSFRDGVRSAAEEGKKAAREARDFLKSMADSGWDGSTVHIHVDNDGSVTGTADKGSRFGWPERDSGEEKNIPAQDVLRLDVETTGDVELYLDDDPDAPVRVEGNMSRLEVFVTEDGTLKVRPLVTASNQFFAFRGVSRQDVSLTVPARTWESVRLATDSGDVDVSGELEVGSFSIHTRSGDVSCRVKSCQQAQIKSASGDVQMEGNAAALRIETASGDVELAGPVGQAEIKTTSGDVELAGSVWKASVRTASGDIRLESMTLPEAMELSSASGDVEVRIPDNGPFKVSASSVSGTVDLRPFERWSWSGDADPNAPVPRYTLTSISGDVSLDKC